MTDSTRVDQWLWAVRIYKSDGNLNCYVDETVKMVWELSR